MTAKFEKTKKYNAESKSLMSDCLLALEACNFKVKNFDIEASSIQASARISFLSFGEKIHVKVHEDGSVTMKSKCALPTPMIA